MISRRHPHGFTLIEALVALVILGVALAGIVELFLNSQAQSRRNAQRLQLTLLARQQMEELKGAGFDALQQYFDQAPKHDGAAYYPAQPREIGPGGDYYAAMRIEHAGPLAFRVTLSLTTEPMESSREAVGATAAFTLTELIEGGAQ